MMTEHDFFCFPQLLRCDAGVFHLIHNAQRQVLGGFAFLWIDSGIDAKQTWIARCVRECRDAKRQTGLFTHTPIQTRAAPIAEDSREQIERGYVWICKLWDVPGERQMRQFSRKFLMHFAAAKLRWLRRNKQR